LRAAAGIAHDCRHEYPECAVHGSGGASGHGAAADRTVHSRNLPRDRLAECTGGVVCVLACAGIPGTVQGVADGRAPAGGRGRVNVPGFTPEAGRMIAFFLFAHSSCPVTPLVLFSPSPLSANRTVRP